MQEGKHLYIECEVPKALYIMYCVAMLKVFHFIITDATKENDHLCDVYYC